MRQPVSRSRSTRAIAWAAVIPPSTSCRARWPSLKSAASTSPANTWTPALEGATIRNLYPGRSAWNGLLAAELHACGFTSLPDAPSDVYGTILADTYDPELAIAGLDTAGHGERFRIEQNYFKLHACCRYNHFALDAVATLRRDRRL